MQHESDNTTIAVRIPLEQAKFLRDKAEENDRTVSQEVRRLIRQAQEIEAEREAA